jgi:ribonuclease VapC
MVIDTSAVLAILQDEPERSRFTEAIAEAAPCSMSAAPLLEVAIVVESRFGVEGGRHLDHLLERAGVEIVAVDEEQVRMAREAYRRFGRGRHHARLNFGDCFSYALAFVRQQRLLFKGDDFAQTDIAPVV